MYAKQSAKVQARFRMRRDIFLKNTFNPILKNHKLHSPLEGYRSINITGDIRAIYKEESERIVIFVAIGTHGELYRS